ncbi:MAG TPA: hypothetical protein VF194_02825 [Ferrovibrio sp.]|uniref:hypothetical protein n=1 Tax=Ferrovibrio sp. TaxID=1917215 RepID=UPI002ED31332
MTGTRKFAYLAGASALAVGLMTAAPNASAFDKVDWSWDLDVRELIKAYIDICAQFDPTGLLNLEAVQIQIGDVTADSTVYDIYNLPGDPTKDKDHGHGHGNSHGLSWFVPTGHNPSQQVLDATKELPEVISTAVAVANNANIDTDAATQLHIGQFAFDANDNVYPASSNNSHGHGGPGPNENIVGAGALTLAAILGSLDKAEISATSTVYDIKNATVDSSATAVANNLNVNVAPTSDSNSLFIGDVTQFAYADVSATSSVNDVWIKGYKSLAPTETVLGRPIVSSVATAVGNNLSITVKAPSP